MEVSHRVNWNSIIYGKGAIHRTEFKTELAAKDFNINLVEFPLPYYVISNMPGANIGCQGSDAQIKKKVRKKYTQKRKEKEGRKKFFMYTLIYITSKRLDLSCFCEI